MTKPGGGRLGKLRGRARKLADGAKLLSPALMRHLMRSVDLKKLQREHEFLQHYPLGRDEWGLMFPHGMGDLYVTCGYAKEIVERHGGSGFAVFVKPHVSYIPTLFDGVTRVVPVPDFNLKQIQQPWVFEAGRLVSIFPVQRYWNVLGYKGFHFLDYYCLFYGLPYGTLPRAPRGPNAAERDRAKALMAKHGLREGQSVLLAPDAVSTDNVAPELWKQLATTLKAQGLDVAMNNPRGASPAIPGATSIDLPLDLANAFAEAAGRVIAVRSGLCDLLAHAKTKLAVVYPDAIHKGGPLIDGFGLRASGLRPDAHEVVMKADPSATARAVLEGLR